MPARVSQIVLRSEKQTANKIFQFVCKDRTYTSEDVCHNIILVSIFNFGEIFKFPITQQKYSRLQQIVINDVYLFHLQSVSKLYEMSQATHSSCNNCNFNKKKMCIRFNDDYAQHMYKNIFLVVRSSSTLQSSKP